MYRCRRIFAIVLSLAVFTSFFVFSASADDSTVGFFQAQVSFLYESGEWSNSQWISVSDQSFLNLSGTTVAKQWRITAFRFYPGYTQNLDLWFTFSVGMFHNSTNLQYGYFTPTPNGSHSGTINNSSMSQFLCFTTTGGDYEPTIEPYNTDFFKHTRNCLNFSVRLRSNATYDIGNANQATFTLTNPILISANNNADTQIVPFFFNCNFWANYDYLLNYHFGNIQTTLTGLNTLLTNNLPSIKSSCSTINTAVQNMNDRLDFLFTNTYYWNQVEYDSLTEQLTTTSQSGDFFNALLGSIQSISADSEAQAAMQEKANSKGAGDALDDAYDSAGSSFGSLSDFSGISDAAPWSPSQFSDRTESGFLSWFSSATKNSIDAVPRSRAPGDEDIVDFYSSNLNDIINSLGGE